MRRQGRLLGWLALIVLIGVAVGGCLSNQPAIDSGIDVQELPAYGILTTEQAVQVMAALQDHPAFVLLDIRTPNEVAASHISGAIELDFYNASFRDDLDELDRDLIYLIYCRTGNRTGQTMEIMDQLGFEKVYDMGGGITQWIAAGHPVCVGSLDAEHSCSSVLPTMTGS